MDSISTDSSSAGPEPIVQTNLEPLETLLNPSMAINIRLQPLWASESCTESLNCDFWLSPKTGIPFRWLLASLWSPQRPQADACSLGGFRRACRPHWKSAWIRFGRDFVYLCFYLWEFWEWNSCRSWGPPLIHKAVSIICFPVPTGLILKQYITARKKMPHLDEEGQLVSPC